jgi:hypothetical protein
LPPKSFNSILAPAEKGTALALALASSYLMSMEIYLYFGIGSNQKATDRIKESPGLSDLIKI